MKISRRGRRRLTLSGVSATAGLIGAFAGAGWVIFLEGTTDRPAPEPEPVTAETPPLVVINRGPDPVLEVPTETIRTITVENVAIGLTLEDANIRATPNGEVVGSVAANVEVELISCEGAWCQIAHNGTRGYIFAEFVRFIRLEQRP